MGQPGLQACRPVRISGGCLFQVPVLRSAKNRAVTERRGVVRWSNLLCSNEAIVLTQIKPEHACAWQESPPASLTMDRPTIRTMRVPGDGTTAEREKQDLRAC